MEKSHPKLRNPFRVESLRVMHVVNHPKSHTSSIPFFPQRRFAPTHVTCVDAASLGSTRVIVVVGIVVVVDAPTPHARAQRGLDEGGGLDTGGPDAVWTFVHTRGNA